MRRHLALIISLILCCSAGVSNIPSLKKTSNGLVGFVDKSKGEYSWQVFPQFSDATDYYHYPEAAMVSRNGIDYAIIDKFGNLRTGYIFPGKVSWNYESGLGVCGNKKGEYKVVNLKGEVLVSRSTHVRLIGDRLAIRGGDDNYLLTDYNIDPVSIDKYKYFTPQILDVDGKKIRLMIAELASRGKKIVDMRGDDIAYFDDIVPVKYSMPYEATEDMRRNGWAKYEPMLYMAQMYGKWGLVSVSGRKIVPFKYASQEKLIGALKKHYKSEIKPYLSRQVESDLNTLAERTANVNNLIMTNLKGKTTGPITPETIASLPIVKSYLMESGTQGRKYLSRGNIKVGPFRDVESCGFFWIVTKPNGLKYLYDSYGDQITTTGYSNIKLNGFNDEYVPYFLFTKNRMYGLMDYRGEIILNPEYQEIGTMRKGYGVASAKKGGKYYPISAQNGKLLSSIGYDFVSNESGSRVKVRRGGEDLEIYAHNGKEVVSLEDKLRQKEREKEAKKRELAARQERERQQAAAAHAAQHNHAGHQHSQSSGNNPNDIVQCNVCKGSGRCIVCNGSGSSGVVLRLNANIPMNNKPIPCMLCGGRGVCYWCNGAGSMTRAEEAAKVEMARMQEAAKREARNSSSSSSYSSSSSSGSRNTNGQQYNRSECPKCHGTGIDPRPVDEGQTHYSGLTVFLGYVNDSGNKCPHCGRYTRHMHSKCSGCNIPTHY